MKPNRVVALKIALFLSVAQTLPAQQDRQAGEQLYQNACATCHGADLRGGHAQSLVDGIWQFGASRQDFFLNIKHGIPDFSMPSFETALTDQQISQIYDFLKNAERSAGVRKPPPPQKISTLDYEVDVKIWAEGLSIPWSIAFLDEHTALIVERPGRLRVVKDGALQSEPVQGTPSVLHEGQGGLLDVALDPHFNESGWLYLAYSHALPTEGSGRPLAMTRVVRGRIRDHTWSDQQVVFEAAHDAYLRTRHHYGSRIVFDRDDNLYFSIGERGMAQDAQDLSKPNGKVHRVRPDGSIPRDNPFIGQKNALPSIFTYGNRNPQGLAVDPRTGKVWESEHGPMGGDELNLLVAGRNYGWPVATYGRDYSGAKITDVRERPGIEAPIAYWNPSPAVCGMSFVKSDLFPRWRNKLMVGALRYEEVRLLTIEHDRVLHQEILLKSAGRVRQVVTGPDGAIYAVLNGPDVVLRLTPIRDVNEGFE